MTTTMLLWLVSPFVAQAVHLGSGPSVGELIGSAPSVGELSVSVAGALEPPSVVGHLKDDRANDMRPNWAQTGNLNGQRPRQGCTPTKLIFTPKSSEPQVHHSLTAEDGIFRVDSGNKAKKTIYEIVAAVNSGAMSLRELGLNTLGKNVRIAVFSIPETLHAPCIQYHDNGIVSVRLEASSRFPIRIEFGTCVPSIVFRNSQVYSFVLTDGQSEHSYWQLPPQGFLDKFLGVEAVAKKFGGEKNKNGSFGGRVSAYFPTLPEGYSADERVEVTEASLTQRSVFKAKSGNEGPQPQLSLPAVTADPKSKDPQMSVSQPCAAPPTAAADAKSLPPAQKKGVVKRFFSTLSEKLKRKKDAVKRGLTKFANMFRSKKTKA